MKKALLAIGFALLFAGCSSTVSYNEEGVLNFLESTDATWWVQEFTNRSNLIESKERMAIVISNRDLNGREVSAIKQYMLANYEVDQFEYYYYPEYY